MAITDKALAGIAYLSVDGKRYMLAGDLSYSVSRRKRETLIGQDEVHGFSETPHAGFIQASVRDAGSLSLADINAMTNVTVMLELTNGKMVVGRNMWTTDPQEVETMEAKFTVRWEGVSIEEIGA
jgi:hypothetical protein